MSNKYTYVDSSNYNPVAGWIVGCQVGIHMLNMYCIYKNKSFTCIFFWMSEFRLFFGLQTHLLLYIIPKKEN